MLYNLIEIEAIKLAVKNLDEKNYPAQEILLKSIGYLEEKYVETGELYFLYKSIWHIYAYLELKYTSCDFSNELFEKILGYLELSFEELIKNSPKICEEIMLNKINIRNLLGRWNPILQSMNIENAVNDILYKVSNKEIGKYIYHCGKVIETEVGKTMWEYMYVLTVNKNSNLFFDVKKRKYYLLKEKS